MTTNTKYKNLYFTLVQLYRGSIPQEEIEDCISFIEESIKENHLSYSDIQKFNKWNSLRNNPETVEKPVVQENKIVEQIQDKEPQKSTTVEVKESPKPKNNKRPIYASIPTELIQDRGVKDKAKFLYGFIRGYSLQKGYCFAKNETFAELLGCSVANVKKLMRDLCDNGYIRSETYFNGNIKKRQIYITEDFGVPNSANSEV